MTSPLGFWGDESETVLLNRFPLHKACRDGDATTLSRLVAGATRDELVAEDQFYSWTPIHWAAYFGKNDCLIGLLRCGVEVNIKTSKFLQTPAHIAAFGGHPNTLHELMHNGADFHARDYLGEIPLHKAARVGNVECLQILVTSGTHVNICNNNGMTASHIARKQHFTECLRLLELAEEKLNSNQCLNGSHPILNGVSGAHVLSANGHSNGINGNGNETLSRKRTFDDISIPLCKRARVTDKTEGNPEVSALKPVPGLPPSRPEQCKSIEHCGVETPYIDMDYETHHNDIAPPALLDEVARAPSPGMDMSWDLRDDMQLWGHLQGYGDTAECIPDENSYSVSRNADIGKTGHQSFRGVQLRGWR